MVVYTNLALCISGTQLNLTIDWLSIRDGHFLVGIIACDTSCGTSTYFSYISLDSSTNLEYIFPVYNLHPMDIAR